MINHADYPFSPAEGYRAGANYLTIGLFLERYRPNDAFKPLYSLSECDVEEDGVVYPSARQIYIHSKGEHDAMRKLVGSFKQWQQLKELDWFRKEWELWHAEWQMMSADRARLMLEVHALKNPSAAKTLFDDANKGKVGRPTKRKGTKPADDGETDSDISRVVQLVRK